jgi:D-apiose dehydrogenase
MRRFKIAIVGCGGVSQLHATAYTRHPERVEVVAAVDPELDRAEQLAASMTGCTPFASIEAAERGAVWDIGVVCSPTPVRVAVVDELAQAGKHVFVEKPLADNLADATKMVDACGSAAVLIAVHQNFRYFYPFDMARGVISAGRIGGVTTVVHRELMFRHDEGWRTTTRRHALAVMGIHWLDGFRWMLGDEPVNVLCKLHSAPAVDAHGETEVIMQASFAKGATVSYVESFSFPGYELDTTVIGERGSLRLDSEELSEWALAAASAPAVTRHPVGVDKPEATFLAFDQLLQAIESGSTPSNGGRDNLSTVAFLEAAYKSAETGEPVMVASELAR